MKEDKYQKLQQLLKSDKEGVIYYVEFCGKESGSLSELKQGFVDNQRIQQDDMQDVLHGGEPVLQESESGEVFLEPFYKQERMIILGGGHIAVPLSQMAKMVGFYVVVSDDRVDFANEERFPCADEVHCAPFTRCIHELRPGKTDYVVIVTRGHSHDTECLEELFQFEEPFYTGMIGSSRRTTIVMDNLEKVGYNKKRLQRVCTPIGLPIGAKTVEEIDISIMAEIIQRRRKDAKESAYIDRGDHDMKVLADFTRITKPCVIATIMKSEGSAPRAAGARMAVFMDGTIIGSIGGGCVEGGIIHTAKQMIGTGTYRIVRANLDGDVAMAEGMVCGGKVTVFLEDWSFFN